MEFDKRKVSAMASMSSTEPDKSPKGDLDFPIVPLLTAINSHPSFFTTSSCSGRISIFSHPNTSSSAFVSKKKAKGGTWIFVSHEKVHPSSVLHLLYPSGTASDPSEANSETLPQSLVFRFEPLIIAVECKDVEAAQCLVSLAISCGFRESGITNVSKRVIVAIRCSIRLEVPLGDAGKLMVSPEYVTFLIDVANEKMEANMKRTDLFLDVLIKNGFSRTGLHMNQDRIKFPATKALESCEENRGEILQGEPESISEGTS